MELNLNNPESSSRERKAEDRFEFIDRLCVRISNEPIDNATFYFEFIARKKKQPRMIRIIIMQFND